MKKFARILALCLAALLLTVSLVACAVPAKDPDKALAALEEADYIVGKDTRILPAAFALAGYKLDAVVSGSTLVEDKEGDLMIEHVTIYYFADAENAKKAMEEVKKYADEDKEESDEGTTWVAPKRVGNMIYYGTKAGVKAAK